MAKRRPSGDGMVRKRDDGRWEGRIIVGHKKNGEPIYRYIFAKTQSELIQKLHDKIERYRDADLSEDCNITLGEWLDKWLYEYAALTIRPNTLNGYELIVRNQIKPHIGNRTLSALSTNEIQEFYNTIKKQGRVHSDRTHGKELADSMVRKTHMLLHEALDMAVQQRLLIVNPTNGTTIPKNNYKEKQVLNDKQLEKFMMVIREDKLWYDFFYTELTTGLRKGEICGLRWGDFDENSGRLKIKRSVGALKDGVLPIGETKTETGAREILLPPSTAAILKARKENAVGDWIFHNFHKPEEPMNPQSAYTHLKVILKKAELPLIRFHDLRHTFATHAIAEGVDAKTLSGILGHTNASFTLDTYTHVTTDMQKSAAKIVGNFMDEIIGGVDNG